MDELRQRIPIYYPADPASFRNGSSNSGAAGARAAVTFDIPNDPHLIYGVRLVVTCPLPFVEPTEAQLRLFQAAQTIYDDNLIRIDISQLSMAAISIHQRALCGSDGVVWHPFPDPFPAAGGNKWTITATRLTSLPDGYEPLLSASLVTTRLTGKMAEGPSIRRG